MSLQRWKVAEGVNLVSEGKEGKGATLVTEFQMRGPVPRPERKKKAKKPKTGRSKKREKVLCTW
ncbi:hypothetical protein ZHAS_00008864 [Anopheles sinensis]|uniref:Uncharacterized protein n=1 Tax=Anopheles sinensis TaxID=74873 RepID=A0A084VTH8_ANOSI|nr:hypothetical protein ZHAS_00008864 [Anopheles sinensis]